jgi:phosphoglycerol transferase MdoB-like AlkP superfamily enzyme
MLTKRSLNTLFLLLFCILFYVFLNRYYQLRDAYYKEYLKHKEVMFLMKNYKQNKRQEPSEDLLKSLISQVGGEFFSMRQTDTGYEVKARKISGASIPKLVYSLEERGIKIDKFKAVDNTGQGLFDVEMVLR